VKKTSVGMNRTGVAMSPVLARAMVEGTEALVPAPGDATGLVEARRPYLLESEGLGSVPPPPTIKGMAKTVMKALKGERATVLLDKLAARLAFERTGARLYQAFIGKLEVLGPPPGGPTLEEAH
jgi:hypothetical protein